MQRQAGIPAAVLVEPRPPRAIHRDGASTFAIGVVRAAYRLSFDSLHISMPETPRALLRGWCVSRRGRSSGR